MAPHKHENSPFYQALAITLRQRNRSLTKIAESRDAVARRVLHDYGAIFVANESVLPPPVCVFTCEEEVTDFQARAGFRGVKMGGALIELQPAAANALLQAQAAAQAQGLDITPRDGAEAARRSYDDTVRLWNSRFLPALDHWQELGRLTEAQTKRLRAMPTAEQVAEVLELEKQGIFFSKDFSKSILYSIAAPGTSQHIAMLAFDANEFLDERVREILARHGWFQTVLSDLPHFTFLGWQEAELPARGLKPVEVQGQKFWIPDVG
ncbi:MAG TPA: hypothetical protein VLH87_05810 [Pyrinomonadaceae bacterium]|nr:hypothetical protein [Pyrinomonadaceae bacterium]